MLDEMYQNCKWCRLNTDGKCEKIREVLESSAQKELYELVEGGKLSEVIREGITFPKMYKARILMARYGISHKRQEEILKAVGVDLEEFAPSMVESLDDSIGNLILNTVIDQADLKFTDPEGFGCKYFE